MFNRILFIKNISSIISLYEVFKEQESLSDSTYQLCKELNGDGEIRTHDPLLARQVLSQLSYAPIMGLSGLEPPTSRLSGVRSNRLSYKPSVKLSFDSGDGGIRTLDPLLARQVLSQLSYTPVGSGSHLLSHAVSNIVSSAA